MVQKSIYFVYSQNLEVTSLGPEELGLSNPTHRNLNFKGAPEQ